MKNVLILSFSNLKTDARVTRQINFIKDHYHVTVFCFDAYPNEGEFEIYKVDKTKLTFFRKALSSIFLLLQINKIAYRILYNYKKHISFLRKKKFDLIVANDIETLPLAFEIVNSKSKVFFDAHEYAPRQFEDRLYWRIFFQRFTTDLCKQYISRVDGMSTINGGLANAYETNFGVKPIVITNAADYFQLLPKKRENYPIKLVHHCIINFSRRPDIMIDLFQTLDNRFTLDLIYMLPENAAKKTKAYFEEFKIKALQTGRIRILPALKSNEIVSFLHTHYDMGIILVPPVNFNYENGLPNKLFDCIQARLAMAVGPLREIAHITTHYNIGIVSKDFTAQGMAEELNKLTMTSINLFKENAHGAAEKMNSDKNKELFLQTLKKIG
jgi:hypothetical protein